jgi:hypothetical protein
MFDIDQLVEDVRSGDINLYYALNSAFHSGTVKGYGEGFREGYSEGYIDGADAEAGY